MYQYVLSKEVVPPFSLYMPHPRSLLLLSNDGVAPYGDSRVIVESENQSYDQNVLDVLSDTNVSVYHFDIIFYYYSMNLFLGRGGKLCM